MCIRDRAKTEPSVDQWLREAKADPVAAQCGMFLTHNGVVRITPKAQVREGVEGLGEVAAAEFSYDAEGLAAAEAEDVYKRQGSWWDARVHRPHPRGDGRWPEA